MGTGDSTCFYTIAQLSSPNTLSFMLDDQFLVFTYFALVFNHFKCNDSIYAIAYKNSTSGFW